MTQMVMNTSNLDAAPSVGVGAANLPGTAAGTQGTLAS